LPSEKADGQSELTFYIRPEKGLTARLYQHALDKPECSVSVLVDGPYGGINMQRYEDSDQLLVVSGGSGAGWCLPFIEQMARHRMITADEDKGQVVRTSGKEASAAELGSIRSSSGPLSLRVIMATRDASCRTWFLKAVNELLSKYLSSNSPLNTDIQVEVYLTDKAAQSADLESKLTQDPTSKGLVSSTDKNNVKEEGHGINLLGRELEGRPQLPQIIQEVSNAADIGQSLSVLVCGPTTMQNDVRNAVAEENLKILQGSKTGAIYLHTEHFSWA
jgi:NAD(P)H-flavin reductase